MPSTDDARCIYGMPEEVRSGISSKLFYNQFKSTLRGGIRSYECSVTNVGSVKTHCHPAASFLLILDGGHTETVGSRTVEQVPMSVTFHPPYREHRNHIPEAGCRAFRIEIEMDLFEHLTADVSSPFDLAHHFPNKLTPYMVRMLRAIRNQDEFTQLYIEGMSMELIAEAARQGEIGERKPPWLKHLLDRLRDSVSDVPSLTELAEEFKLNPSYLSRAFSKNMRCTLSEYVRRQKISAACRLIARGTELQTIATSLGFSDQAHFTRSFRSVMGMPPSRFRAMKK